MILIHTMYFWLLLQLYQCDLSQGFVVQGQKY